ncbi:MAG: alpha/beta fold hydrolase [Desulfobacteraceae bacterium]|nr:alpha/beta fold hydrolase [Desulfobacteraceae bacterium]
MSLQEPFLPPPGLKGPNIQTILASSRFRAARAHPVFDNAREKIFETKEGVRLQGFYSPRPQQDAKGLVLLLHGWEGSARSTYILTTARYLFDHGYEVFRLNLRDHGDTHHLNRGLFFGTLFDEVFEATEHVANLSHGNPFFVAGFSLGGNYALRIARETVRRSISQLCHVVAVSPVLSPGRATEVIDKTVFYRNYFLKKWKRSLLRKQQLYPDLYDFSQALSHNTILDLTADLLPRYSPYKEPEEYFGGYTLLDDELSAISVPTAIIASKDDPIIPVEDFYSLRLNEITRLVVHPFGGHNGFIENYRLCAWYERAMIGIFSKEA